MQITTILLSTVLALSTGAHGWKPDKDGVMVADDAAQACENSIIGDKCSYWANGEGKIDHGSKFTESLAPSQSKLNWICDDTG
jgi:hypothetical protein